MKHTALELICAGGVLQRVRSSSCMKIKTLRKLRLSGNSHRCPFKIKATWMRGRLGFVSFLARKSCVLKLLTKTPRGTG